MLLDNLIGGVASLIGSGVGAATTAAENRKDREWNAEQAELNRQYNSAEAELNRQFQTSEREAAQDFNLEQWNRENEYNTPVAQMQRMVAAGINPNVAAQSIGGNAVSPGSVRTSGQSGSQASSSAATSNVNPGAIGQILGNSANSALDAMNIQQDVEGKDIDNAWKDRRYAKELAKVDKEIEGITAEIGLKGEQADLAKQTAWSIAQKTPKEIEAIEAGLTKIVAEIDMMDKQKEKIDSDIAVNEADISLKGAQELTEESKQANIAASTEETIIRTQLADMGFGLSETQFIMRYILSTNEKDGEVVSRARASDLSEDDINEYSRLSLENLELKLEMFWNIVKKYERVQADVQADLYKTNRKVDSEASYKDRSSTPWELLDTAADNIYDFGRRVWKRGWNAF